MKINITIMFITITSLFREVKLITTLIINITQHNNTKKSVIRHLLLGKCYLQHIHFEKKGPTPKTLKLYDYKRFFFFFFYLFRCPTSYERAQNTRLHR